MPLGQVRANRRPRFLSMLNTSTPSRPGAMPKSSNLPALEVVGEQVAPRVRLVARGRDAHGFLALDDAIDADVRREVELAVGLDEVDVALALGDGFAALLAAGLGEVAQLLDLLRLGVEAEHLGALINIVRTEHVVNLPVAAGAHGVIAVVAEGEAGVVSLGGDLLALVGLAVGDDELSGQPLRRRKTGRPPIRRGTRRAGWQGS